MAEHRGIRAGGELRRGVALLRRGGPDTERDGEHSRRPGEMLHRAPPKLAAQARGLWRLVRPRWPADWRCERQEPEGSHISIEHPATAVKRNRAGHVG